MLDRRKPRRTACAAHFTTTSASTLHLRCPRRRQPKAILHAATGRRSTLRRRNVRSGPSTA
eukprot:5695611-Pleurochrysis_carterae.AAC.1